MIKIDWRQIRADYMVFGWHYGVIAFYTDDDELGCPQRIYGWNRAYEHQWVPIRKNDYLLPSWQIK